MCECDGGRVCQLIAGSIEGVGEVHVGCDGVNSERAGDGGVEALLGIVLRHRCMIFPLLLLLLPLLLR